MSNTGIGASLPRLEDQRFITGRGRYTDDIHRPGQVYAHILRSNIAHGDLLRIDCEAAQRAPDVLAVLTGKDLRADGLGELPVIWMTTNRDGTPMFVPPRPVLAIDRVRHVGEPVAVIIAATPSAAKDAAELIEIEIADLPAAANLDRAIAEDAPQIWDGAAGNVGFHWHTGDARLVDQAFARASHVTKIDLINNRLIANPMEPRVAIGEFDAGRDEFVLYLSSQNPHVQRILLATATLRVPEHKIRVVSPDVGGGFGCKAMHYAEEVIVLWASRRLGRPVKWTSERSEAFLSDAQGRDHKTHAELALDAQGRFLALRVDTRANLGAYYSTFGPAIPTFYSAPLLVGTYDIPAAYCEVRGVFTNTVPVDAYRGAGRPEASFVIERIVDEAARELGMDPAEIRRLNFVPPDKFPYVNAFGSEYDSGNFGLALDKALVLGDYAGFPARRVESERRGKLRGIGMSSYIEACGAGPSKIIMAAGGGAGFFESATVRVNPTGSVVVVTGTHSHGQGHETTFAQVVSERLGVPVENIEIVHGDTARSAFGNGTVGSRSLAVGGGAIVRAIDKVVDKGKRIAARILEAAESDMRFENGRFLVVGTDRGLSFPELAFMAHAPNRFSTAEVEPGLDETAFFDPANFTYPAGLHLCELEIDPETGATDILAYTVVDDFGNVINPMVVEGQVHGGTAQGIGQALLENCVYDPDSAQLLSGTFMDYCMPRADDMPGLADFKLDYIVTPSPHNPLGVKGCGEAGAIAAPPAVMNAVLHALRPAGVTDLSMPATPHKIWQALQSAPR
jgi:carbon-monoxide dehydrogenase large subunit